MEKSNDYIFKDIFEIFDIDCNNENDLLNITLDFDCLKNQDTIINYII